MWRTKLSKHRGEMGNEWSRGGMILSDYRDLVKLEWKRFIYP